ncbi:MAG: arylsulfatase [Acidimicrobiales bacterium]
MSDATPRRGPAAAYAGFEGRVGRTVAGSQSWWPPPALAPAGAPNVVVVLVDDVGFGDLGCYGSEIATPNLDRLAGEGLRFSDYHATPMCSPTRASLLTGVNPHRAGVGHVAHSDPGFPGYAMELAYDVATMAETFRASGWATYMVGKWHLTKDSHCSDAGPRHSWPCQRGFDRFYGILDGFTNLHQPHRLVEDNHQVDVDAFDEDYYFTHDITERALDMIRAGRAADPSQPFLLYLSHGAAHAPLHARPDDMARYRGRYDAGWDALRAERCARQVELGLLPPGTAPAPRNAEPGHDVEPWDDLSPGLQRLFARYMEAYAGMVDAIDQSLGRLLEGLEELDVLDDTIIVFTSDNGASREGEAEGTTAYYVHLLGQTDLEADLGRIDEIGGPTTMPHYPRGWAMAGNTPFRLYKINTHAGGHRVPFVVRVPPSVAPVDEPGSLRHGYVHVTDILPTLLELAGVAPLATRGGTPVQPMAGVSFAAMLGDREAPSTHREQLTEMLGHRGYYRDGWEIVTLHDPMTPFGEHEWQLYDLRADPTELDDLAAVHPERVAELAAAWERAAWDQQVFPLDEGSALKYVIRPPWDERFERPVTILPGTPTLERWRSLQLVMLRSCDIAIDVDHAPGDVGVLVAHGDQGGGYLVWVDDDGLHAAHNDGRGRLAVIDGGPLAPGRRIVDLVLTATGGNRWDALLRLDGDDVGAATGWPCLFPMAPFQGIDVGLDRRSPVHWDLARRHGTFPYTGRIAGVTYTPGAPAADAPVNLVDVLRTMGARFE